MTILYGSAVSDATLVNACDMATTTGGIETSKTTTTIGFAGGVYGEILSQGGTSIGVAAIPAIPTGHGWAFRPGPGTYPAGNWSAAITLSSNSWGGSSANTDVTVRFSKYSGGVYTIIGTLASVGITSTSKTTYTFTAVSMAAITFASNDLVHVELWWHDTNTTINNDSPVVYASAVSYAGVANDMQITTPTFQYTPTYSNADASINKYQVIKAYDSSGNFLGIINDASYVSGFKESINAACGTLTLSLPRPIDAYNGANQPGSDNTIVMGNNIQVWMYGAGLPSSGLLRYNGVIDTITPKLDESGKQTVDVLITPYSQLVLGDHSVTSTLTFGTAGSATTYIDTGAIFQSFFTGTYNNSSGVATSTIDADTGQAYGNPYTMDPASVALTNQKTQFAFQNQDMLSALTNVLQLSPPNYFFRMNQNKTVFFGIIPSTPTYTLLLGQHITSIEFPQDNAPRKNVIVVQGKGVQGKYTGSSVSTLGKRTYFKSDNRITDAAVAQLLANGLGAIYDQTVIRAKVKIPDYRGDQMPGLGYDIEKFKVGETVKIIDARAPAASVVGNGSQWGAFVWGGGKWGSPNSASPTIWGSFNWGGAVWGTSLGTIFSTVVPIMAIQYDYSSVTLELGFRAPTLNRKLFALEAAFADATLVT